MKDHAVLLNIDLSLVAVAMAAYSSGFVCANRTGGCPTYTARQPFPDRRIIGAMSVSSPSATLVDKSTEAAMTYSF
jgi:hypothetical protein